MKREELKAHLKAWERDFARREGRQAKKDDIRADPIIYKYYKDYDSGRRRGVDKKQEGLAGDDGNGLVGSNRVNRRPPGKGHKEPPDTPTPHSSSRPSSSSVKCSDADNPLGGHHDLPTNGKSVVCTPSKVQSLDGQGMASGAGHSRVRLQDTPKTARRLFGGVNEKSNGFMPYQSPQKLKKLILDISHSQSPTRSPTTEARRAPKRGDQSPRMTEAGPSRVDLSPLPKEVRQSIERKSSRYEKSLQELKTPQKPKDKQVPFPTIDPTPVNPERRGGRAFRALLKTPKKTNTSLSGGITSTKTDALADEATQQDKDHSPPPTRKDHSPTPSSPWKKRRAVEHSGLKGAAAKPASNPFAKRALDRTLSAPASRSQLMMDSPLKSHKRLRSVSSFWEDDQAEDQVEDDEECDPSYENDKVDGPDGFDPFLLNHESNFRIPSFGTQALGPDLLRDLGDRLVDDSEDEEDNEDPNIFDERPDADIVNGMSRGVRMGMDEV